MQAIISVDIETTGLDPQLHSILEFCAILEDRTKEVEDLDNFYTLVLPESGSWDNITPFIATFHKDLWPKFQNNYIAKLVAHDVMPTFKQWLDEHDIDKVYLAGKNVGSFDLQFLKRLPDAHKIRFAHRCYDPGSLFATNADIEPPSLETCLSRAGLEPTELHTAYGDALDVLRVLRVGYGL